MSPLYVLCDGATDFSIPAGTSANAATLCLNLVNDATDLAKVLRQLDFDVVEKTNLGKLKIHIKRHYPKLKLWTPNKLHIKRYLESKASALDMPTPKFIPPPSTFYRLKLSNHSQIH
ncbi:MAG: hypothetical protein ABFS56_35685 [Pseudomonadota bacterium]